MGSSLWVLPLHSTCSPKEQQQVFQHPMRVS
jgi:HrpA-like RNA helicase